MPPQTWYREPAVVASTCVVAGVVAAFAARALKKKQRKPEKKGLITTLHRYAVKGLGFEPLQGLSLEVGECFPSDRMWALMRVENLAEFDPKDPKWVHKQNFYSAFSAGGPLARLKTTYFDATTALVVRSKESGDLLLGAKLEDSKERAKAEKFFATYLTEQGEKTEDVRIVRAADDLPHHFGNTNSGTKLGNGDVRVVHLVNAATVKALSDAAGEDINALRFRPNILFDGIEPWEEFQWVGKVIVVGDVEMRVLSRSVRCAATCVDSETGAEASNIPELLQQHFPEHGPYLGIYAQVVRAGTMQFGDSIGLI